jgi:hypothetical protein
VSIVDADDEGPIGTAFGSLLGGLVGLLAGSAGMAITEAGPRYAARVESLLADLTALIGDQRIAALEGALPASIRARGSLV